MSLHRDNYEYAGTGHSGAPLLLIHGWGMHGGMWGGIAEKLAEHFNVYAVDLPGHGFSALPSPAGGITSDLAAVVSQPSRKASSPIRGAGGEGCDKPALTLTLSRLRERESNQEFALDTIVDKLSEQFDQPLTVCGWSLGGQIALRWAAREPEKIKRLVLVASTPCFAEREDWPFGMAHNALQQFAADLEKNHAATLRRFLALQVRGSEGERELLEVLRERIFSRGEPHPDALRGGLEILRDADLRELLPEIKQPTLVIAGERDKLTPPAASHHLTQTLPDARMVEIKGAAHTPFLSHPDEFVAELKSFIET